MMKKFKLKKGDQVYIISGKDKGKSGEIIEVLKSHNKVKVRGINIVKNIENLLKKILVKLKRWNYQFIYQMYLF